MAFHVYVLKSLSTAKRYIGQTSSLEKRLEDHNNGLSIYTKNTGPWRLIHSEVFNTRSEAMEREGFLKSGQSREFLKSLGK